MDPPPCLETERLMLRPLVPADLVAMSRLMGDAEALAHWGEPLDTEGARTWIARNMGRYEAMGIGRCGVILRQSRELIGDCGLIPTTVEGAEEIELGWIIAAAHQGRGFATEAAAAWRDYGFGAMGLQRLVSMISEPNLASRRVAEKLGFTVERPAVWDGEPMLMYSLDAPSRSPD